MIQDTHGWLLTLTGSVDQGIDLLRQVADTNTIPDAHYHLAEAYLRKGFGEEAVRQLDIASEMLKKREMDKQPVDRSTLKEKIDAATARAGDTDSAAQEHCQRTGDCPIISERPISDRRTVVRIAQARLPLAIPRIADGFGA